MVERVSDDTGLSQAEPVSRLGPSGFDPSRWHGPRYSPNLNRWLAKQKRRGGLCSAPSVFRDTEMHRWIGVVDSDGWFCGTRLPRCLTVGARAEVYAHPPGSLALTEEPDFWLHYNRIGRCHIDPQHNGWWATENERWLTEGDARSCVWCGEHKQHLRRWTEAVKRERWEPAIPNGETPR